MPKTTDPYHELASMFLTGGNSTAASTHTAQHPSNPPHLAQRAAIELLIVGNLPVRGNLWLPPYADAVALELGGTALVRLDGPEPSIQLLRCAAAATTVVVGGRMTDAVNDIAPFVDSWVIRTPSNVPIADLGGIAHRVDRITLLTSADEAAAVAAYQLIKQLAELNESATLPPVGLAVVGTDPTTAASIVDRLNRTTISFLGIELELTMCLSRIDAGLKSTRYISFAGQSEQQIDAVIEHIALARDSAARSSANPKDVAGRLYTDRADAEVSRAESVLRVVPAVPPRAASQVQAAAEMKSTPFVAKHDFASEIGAGPHNGRIDSPHPGAPVPPTTAPRKPAIKLAPKPAMAIEAKQPARSAMPDDHGQPRTLASYVDGLKLLSIRAPGHERIEIAVDGEGRLHALAHEQSLRELPVVKQWTRSHRELLVLACPQHPIDSLAETRCHLFTERPLNVADLHSSEFTLHVLTSIQVNGQCAWYAAQLNSVHA